MNEACLDLQKTGKCIIMIVRFKADARSPEDSKAGRCSYLPPKEREDMMLDFRDQILVSWALWHTRELLLTFHQRLIRKISKTSSI